MHTQRHFLGWDSPVVEKVADWLLDGRPDGVPVDFGDTLLVVPTLQAGRRLREALAWRCHQRNTALLSANVVTPQYLFTSRESAEKAASPSLALAVWARVLESADLSKFRAFFPRPHQLNAADRFQWALATGEMVERLRQDLADGGYDIPQIVREHGDELQEFDRWTDLEALEEIYLDKLSGLGFSDTCRLKIAAADNPSLEPGVERVVIAAAPDPALLAVRALEKLASDHAVDILIHAPESASKSFDEWGRPIPAKWATQEVVVPDWERNVFLEASPDTQAERVARILSELPPSYGPSDIGIGAPDRSLITFLDQELRAIGLPSYDPADEPLERHSLGHLAGAMFQILSSGAYVHVADLLRHPDFLCYLQSSRGLEPGALLTELDKHQNHFLPAAFDNMMASFGEREPKDENDVAAFPTLGRALEVIKTHLDSFESKPIEDAWRSFLQAVYASRRIRQDCVEDMEFGQAAALMEDTFRELRRIPADKLQLDGKQVNAIFIRRLLKQAWHRERAGEVLDLQGWLELHWTDTPFLAVTGMNEEFVPGGSVSDVFLPDSLRKILRLRDDLSRLARDVYLLKCLVESRRRDGRLCLIAGKYTLAGDPLKPSRLLFRCSQRELPGRARRLFGNVEQTRRVPAAQTIFKLKPAAGERCGEVLEDKTIFVTAFGDYLACPFRFYLKHVLKMEALSDERMELDAMEFGSVVHEVLRVMGSDKKLWACPDAERLGKELGKLADDALARRCGRNPTIGLMAALSAARARLDALARVQVEIASAGWEIIAVEQNLSLARGGFTIRGRIDRIDRHSGSGEFRIIDYKTSQSAVDPHKRHLARCDNPTGRYDEIETADAAETKNRPRKNARRWADLQLPAYLLLYNGNDAFDPGTALAYFNLPKAITETGLATWDKFDADLMASAVKCLDGVLDDIARRRFWPPADAVRYDEFDVLFSDSPEKIFDTSGFPI